MAEFKNAEEMLKNYTAHGCFVVAGANIRKFGFRSSESRVIRAENSILLSKSVLKSEFRLLNYLGRLEVHIELFERFFDRIAVGGQRIQVFLKRIHLTLEHRIFSLQAVHFGLGCFIGASRKRKNEYGGQQNCKQSNNISHKIKYRKYASLSPRGHP